MASFNKQLLHIDTESLNEGLSLNNFVVALPSVKNFSHPIDQSTMASPKTMFSRAVNR
jgi:hypothetical protein